MSSETAASNHSTKEVEKEPKSEVKTMEPVQDSPPKESVEKQEPEKLPAPVAPSTESGAKIQEAETEPVETEKVKGNDSGEKPKTEESVVDEKKIEPGIESVPEEPVVEKLEGEPEKKLDTETAEIRYGSIEPSVVEKLSEPEKVVAVSEPSSAKAAVEASDEKEVKGSENKPDEISETKPAEKVEQSTVQSVEEKPEEQGETAHVPLQSSVDPAEEKVENLEALPVKRVEPINEREGPVSDAEASGKQKEFKVDPFDEKEKPDEEKDIVKTAEEGDKSLEKVGEVPAIIVEEIQEPKEEEPKLSEAESKEELPALIVEEIQEPKEEKAKFLEAESKPEESSEKEIEAPQAEFKHTGIIETEPAEKQDESKPKSVEENLNEPTKRVIVPEQPLEDVVDKKVVVEESPSKEVFPTAKGAVKVSEPDRKVSNIEEPTLIEPRVEEVPELTDSTYEQKEADKKKVEIDSLPEEEAVSGKTESKTEGQEEKSVTARELSPSEAKPAKSEATENPVNEQVTSRDIDPLAENGNKKDETEVEGNGDEAVREAEQSDPTTQGENIGRSLKEKLLQEKRDDQTTKTDAQAETTDELEDTKAAENAPREEGSVKITHKHSNNIMKMVKHSLVKAKKAIIGKSTNSKAPVSDVKGDEVSK